MTEHRDRLADIQRRIAEFNLEREWGTFHDPKNLAMAIASEAGELLAELRWVESRESDSHARDPQNRVRIEHEVADIAIAVLSFCDRTGIDLVKAVERKLDLNEQKYPAAASRGQAERPVPTNKSNVG